MMRSINISFSLILSFLFLPPFIIAQDFHHVKWGMSRNQILDIEKEYTPDQSINKTSLWYEIKASGTFYSKFRFVYKFNESLDSLIMIALFYNDPTPEFKKNLLREHELKVELNQEEKPIFKEKKMYWKSKIDSSITEIELDQEQLSVFIAPASYKGFRNIDFSSRRGDQLANSDWRTILTFTGTANQTTDDFIINNKWRINWEVERIDHELSMLFFGAEVIDRNGNSEILANVTNDNNGTSVYRTKGTHYLKISSSNAIWKIEVQEYTKQ